MTDSLTDLYFAPTDQSKANSVKKPSSRNSFWWQEIQLLDAPAYRPGWTSTRSAWTALIQPARWFCDHQGELMRRVFRTLRQIVPMMMWKLFIPFTLSPARFRKRLEKFWVTMKIHLIELDIMIRLVIIWCLFMSLSFSWYNRETGRVEAGTLKLVGTNSQAVAEAMEALLMDELPHLEWPKLATTDGKASSDCSSYCPII